jgi:hypothetical protein
MGRSFSTDLGEVRKNFKISRKFFWNVISSILKFCSKNLKFGKKFCKKLSNFPRVPTQLELKQLEN